jgi:hypothetical protein
MMFDINPISLSAVQAFMRLTFVSQQTPDFALSILEQNSLFDLVLEIIESQTQQPVRRMCCHWLQLRR